MAEILIFDDINFGGVHTHLFGSVPDLNQLVSLGVGVLPNGAGGPYSKLISSFVIKSGTWAFYTKPNYQGQVGQNFGPGQYKWVEDLHIPNDSIQSIKLVTENLNIL